jgi:hypothetical protein
MPPNRIVRTILSAGLIAGTLDILAACTQFYINTGKNPEIVLKYISSAVFGREAAYNNGIVMSLAGLLFHYLIATGFAALFMFLYLKIKWIRDNIILSGILFGLFAWALMNLAVVPMSRITQAPFQWSKAIVAMLILIFMIGLPIAMITRWGLKRSREFTT